MTGIPSHLPGFSPQPSHAILLKGPQDQSSFLKHDPVARWCCEGSCWDSMPRPMNAAQVESRLLCMLLSPFCQGQEYTLMLLKGHASTVWWLNLNISADRTLSMPGTWCHYVRLCSHARRGEFSPPAEEGNRGRLIWVLIPLSCQLTLWLNDVVKIFILRLVRIGPGPGNHSNLAGSFLTLERIGQSFCPISIIGIVSGAEVQKP